MGKEEMISKGKAKYKDKVGRIGAAAYYACGDKGGMDVAVCLHETRKKMTVDDWANAWAAAMAA